jgi:hypothetical protein
VLLLFCALVAFLLLLAEGESLGDVVVNRGRGVVVMERGIWVSGSEYEAADCWW